MKKLIFTLTCIAFLVGACVPKDPAPAHDNPEELAEKVEHEAEQDFNVDEAEASYGSCIGCHGQNLEGASGPPLKNQGLDYQQILSTIKNGATGMPGGLVKGNEAENLAAWIADQNK
ncbi:c-type cytochrome [Anaerobacillus sp. MEB173]|uniref:c-type cytochrome n=1 Tax=Anaerobacillus sp. MEB173 TaxID=3383345 RepID=UPI003F9247B2